MFGLPLFLWHCTFPSSINFVNGWFRLHVRNNLFCLFNKVPDLAMDWFAVCSVHELEIFPDIIYFQVHLCVSPCFCSWSTFHVHVAVENMHVHNALLNFLFVAFHTLSMFIIFFECHCQPPYDFVLSPSASINDPIYSKLFTLFISSHITLN